jgi:hypothetical protein
MAQLTRLSLVVALCFLGIIGVAQVTPSGNATSGAAPQSDATSTKIVLKCNGNSGEIHVGSNPGTIITFTTPKSCAPLQSITPDPPGPGFSHKRTNSDGSISYDYDGSTIPSAGYPFSYVTSGMVKSGNGTGVIKN